MALTTATVGGDTFNVNVPGTYHVTSLFPYATLFRSVQKVRTVHVIDTIKPLISLNGADVIVLQCQIGSYNELGASACDACDTALATATVGGDTVNVNVPGTYHVTYDATDASANAGVQ